MDIDTLTSGFVWSLLSPQGGVDGLRLAWLKNLTEQALIQDQHCDLTGGGDTYKYLGHITSFYCPLKVWKSSLNRRYCHKLSRVKIFGKIIWQQKSSKQSCSSIFKFLRLPGFVLHKNTFFTEFFPQFFFLHLFSWPTNNKVLFLELFKRQELVNQQFKLTST